MAEAPNSDDEILNQFVENYCIAATIQGRFAYLLMSLHASNPLICEYIMPYDPTRFLYTNMMYGVGVMIYARPNMRSIGFVNRLTFSVLGTTMFNYTSYQCFVYIKNLFPNRPYLVTFLGFLTGRFLMLHLLAYLYHIDIRGRDRSIPRNSAFDAMYLNI